MTSIRNQRGQGVVEAVLLLALTVAVSMMVTGFLKKNEFAQTLVSKPWKTLAGMMECGTWSGCAPSKDGSKHPNSLTRVLSNRPVN